jgi:hypothetical protein
MMVWYVAPRGHKSSDCLLTDTLLLLQVKLGTLLNIRIAHTSARHPCLLSSPCHFCSMASSVHTTALALVTFLSLIVRPLNAVVTTTGLAEALVTVWTSADIATLLCLESLYVVVLPVQLDMSGASLDTALPRNVSNNTIAELAELRTNVLPGLESAHSNDSVADQVAVTRRRTNDQTNEEEGLVVDAVEGFAELLDVGQLLGAGAPVLVLVAAFDDTGRVGGMTDDCSAVEDTVKVADHLARSHVLDEVAGVVPGVVVGLVAEQNDTLDARTVVVVGQCPVLAQCLVQGVHHMALVVAVDMDVRGARKGGGDEKGCKCKDLGKGDGSHVQI